MNWKNWPYWLRGGVIGGGVAILWVFLFFACTWIDNSSGGFLCLVPLFFGPMFPAAVLFDSVNLFFGNNLPFVVLPIVSIVLWFFGGSIIGALVSYIKLRKQKIV